MFKEFLKYFKNYKKVSFFFLSVILISILFFVVDLLFPIKTKLAYSTVVYSSDTTLIYAFLSQDDKWRMKILDKEISKELEKTMLFKEDKWFYYHFGVNPFSIIRALFSNAFYGKRTSGASTITMQTARLIEPKERTYFSKIKEMFRAIQLEVHYSKKEILKIYMDKLPYGGNIEGVKAASFIYLKKSPEKLSLAEIVALSIIPNRPNSLTPGRNNEVIINERNKWLKKIEKSKLFSDISISDAIDEPFNAKRNILPSKAPHYCLRLKRENKNEALIYGTLNIKQQSKVEKITKDYVKMLNCMNIHNACVLVAENSTGNIIAYVGSADFNDSYDGGQVDGITAIRSPGSTLKPFLYAVGFEKGLITPKTKISDVSSNYNGYEPENYDGKFYGNVSVEFALANSLNIPAVKLLNMLGVNTFISYLNKANFRQISKDEKKMGLSVILGGCGTSLEELTSFYCCFANTGIFKPFSFIKTDSVKKTERLLSDCSVYMTTEILTQLTRPDLPTSWENGVHIPKIAWKTGTSYGRRDAWSIGYNKKFTIGVWVGNFSGESVPELMGATIAAPLLFSVFNAIDYNSPEKWFAMPDSLGVRYVCQESGLIPDRNCTNTVIDYYIPGISSMEKCKHIIEVAISPDSSISYCSECKPETGYIKAFYSNYPPEIIEWFEENKINYKKIPGHNTECSRVFAKGAPVIVSPINKNSYYRAEDDSMEILLKCNVNVDVRKVYWFINKKFYAECAYNEKIFFQPPSGRITIECVDDKGRKSEIWINSKLY